MAVLVTGEFFLILFKESVFIGTFWLIGISVENTSFNEAKIRKVILCVDLMTSPNLIEH